MPRWPTHTPTGIEDITPVTRQQYAAVFLLFNNQTFPGEERGPDQPLYCHIMETALGHKSIIRGYSRLETSANDRK